MFAYTLCLYICVLVLPVAYLSYRRVRHRTRAHPSPDNPPPKADKPLKSIMQAPRSDLPPPKDDPFTMEELRQYDGSDPGKPIYVAIKGTVFDVSHKRDIYGPGKSYGIFAGKDASKGLGMSSLKSEHAVSDYSQLPPAEMKVLNDWYDFFAKRYAIVGRVTNLPPPAVTSPLPSH